MSINPDIRKIGLALICQKRETVDGLKLFVEMQYINSDLGIDDSEIKKVILQRHSYQNTLNLIFIGDGLALSKGRQIILQAQI